MKDTNWKRPINTAWKFKTPEKSKGVICYLNEVTSAGQKGLSSATWNTNKALIKVIHVITSDTNWSLTLYPDSNFDDDGIVPSFQVADGESGDQIFHLDYPYQNSEGDYKLYLKFDGVGPFRIIVIGEVMS